MDSAGCFQAVSSRTFDQSTGSLGSLGSLGSFRCPCPQEILGGSWKISWIENRLERFQSHELEGLSGFLED